MKHLHLLCAVAALQWACTDESTPDTNAPGDADLSATDSRPESFIWDSGGGGGSRGDGGGPEGDGAAGPESDASVVRCFREGAALVEDYVGDPVTGLQGLRVDVDYDGDGTGEILLQRADAAGLHLIFCPWTI